MCRVGCQVRRRCPVSSVDGVGVREVFVDLHGLVGGGNLCGELNGSSWCICRVSEVASCCDRLGGIPWGVVEGDC